MRTTSCSTRAGSLATTAPSTLGTGRRSSPRRVLVLVLETTCLTSLNGKDQFQCQANYQYPLSGQREAISSSTTFSSVQFIYSKFSSESRQRANIPAECPMLPPDAPVPARATTRVALHGCRHVIAFSHDDLMGDGSLILTSIMEGCRFIYLFK